MVGRDHDLADLARRLEERRLVTVVGPAGVGKTRLAVEAAAAAAPAGGAWLVRLDGVPTTAGLADLVEVVAAALHVVPHPVALRERLQGSPTLLVLDSCEHVVDAAAELAQWLCDTTPWLTLLVTSQLALGVEDEEVMELTPLTPEASVELFEELLAAARRSPRPATSADAGNHQQLVADICASLDGLPLALELAAARVRSLPLDEIARRLDDRFGLLRDPSRPADRRHALEGALSWSYELLFPDDQRALQALSCFPGGATLPAVEAVMAALEVPSSAVADTFARLVDRSLVTFDSASAVPRYRLLDSVRTYCSDRLRDAGGADLALEAHASWYAARADECASGIRGHAQARWLQLVRSERADVDAALAWAADNDPGVGERIAVGFGWAWAVLGDGSAGAARIRSATSRATAPRILARARLTAAWLEASAGNLDLAHADLAAAALTQVDDPLLQADLAWCRAFVAIQEGRPADVVTEATRALDDYRRLRLDWHEGAALILLAYGHLMSGDPGGAGRHVGRAVTLIEQAGDQWGLVHARGILAGVAAAEGRLSDAAASFAGAAEAAVAMGFDGQAALHLASRARTLVALEDPRAVDAVDTALQAANRVGDGRLAAGLRVHAAQLARLAGDVDLAEGFLDANLTWFASHGRGDRAAMSEVLLCAVQDDARGLERLAATDLDPASRQTAYDALARLATAAGKHAEARELQARADAVVVPAADFVPRVDRRSVQE
jgi:predicted ATPase